MSKVSITRSLLDDLAVSISNKSGEAVPMTLTEMKDAVDGIQTGGGSVTQDQDGYIVLPSTGGGGGSITVEALSVTQNGTYTAQTGHAYSPVTVNVSSSPSATQHTIYFEFTDSTDATINAWYDSSFISDAITATRPSTYGQKTVSLAQLDGVTWYEPTPIPVGVELIDYSEVVSGVYIGEDGAEHANEWAYASDYTAVDPSMTFSYTALLWYYIGVYDENKNFLRSIYVYSDGTVDPLDSNTGHGELSGNKLIGASYVRLSGAGPQSQYMSLIRTA